MSFELLDDILTKSDDQKPVDENVNKNEVENKDNDTQTVVDEGSNDNTDTNKVDENVVTENNDENKDVNDDSEKVLDEGVGNNTSETDEGTELPENYNVTESIENIIYSNLDQLIENSMRTSLRSTITESAISSDVKLSQLNIVENVVFTKEQMTKFVNDNVHPILDCAGVFNGTYNLGGKEPVAVSLPIFEAALILHIANEGLLESISVEDESPVIKNSLYESIMEDHRDKELDKEKSIKIVNEHLSILYDKYNIEDDADREALLNESLNMIKTHGADNLRPSFYELAECVCEYNKLAEEKDESLFGDVLPKDAELSESDNAFVSAYGRISKRLSENLISQTIKNKFKNVSESKVVENDSSIISIANTATGISSMIAFREGKSQCDESDCLQNAFEDAINSVKAQSNICKNTGNIKMCESCNKKLEESWNIVNEGLKEKAENFKKKYKENYFKGQKEAMDAVITVFTDKKKKCKDDKCREKCQKEIDIAKEGLKNLKEKMKK
jgi:hypothetical protein